MNLIEKHPFDSFIPDNATKLIIGSFPGMDQVANRQNQEEWYYTTKNNLFWTILSEVFQTEVNTRKQKEKLLSEQKIAITDILTKVRRTEKSNLDKYLTDLEFNKSIASIIENNKIDKLFFTSKFVEKHFIREYPQFKFGICLPSPSQAANRSISKTMDYKIYKQLNPDGNTLKYRVDCYKKLLS